jgi:ribose transport system permease protein
MGVGQANTGLTWEFEVISAVVLGGTSLSGGRGNIWGTLMGAIIVGITRNGLNILSVDPQFQQVAIGLILLGAVAIDIATRRTLADRKF